MIEVAAVSQESCPLQWAGRQAVITLPGHLGVSNAARIRDELLSVISPGTTGLIADMTATLSCDHAGAEAVASVYQRALGNGTQLCLVVTAPAVLHVLRINGLDQLIPIYPSLDAAFAAAMTAVERDSPVTEGLRSLEVRWIFPVQLQPAMAGWFDRFPARAESRQDTYLLDPPSPPSAGSRRQGPRMSWLAAQPRTGRTRHERPQA